jgi:hypothetical protein
MPNMAKCPSFVLINSQLGHRKHGIFASQSRTCSRIFLLFAGAFWYACVAFAQPLANAEPDVLIFTNGDKLTGQLERSDGSKVVFKADMAGEIAVAWKKIKQIHTNREFAVIPNGVNVKRGENAAKIPQGTFNVRNQQIQLRNPGAALETIPTADSAYVVDKKTFDRAVLRGDSLLQAWNGSVTLGSSLVEATQRSNTLSGAATLLRVTPQEHWLDRRDRTSLNVSFAYGKLTQPNTPDAKTDIYHLDAEQDEYFTSRFFAFGVAAYDHNFSQGLDLQQSYGAGIGWTVVKNPNNELNLRSSMNYLKEQFQVADLNQNLIGSTFTENYMHKFAHDIVLTEQGSVTPAWNNTNAYSAAGQLGLSIPVYKRLSLSLASVDTFINNPPVGFRKNSVQFTTGLTYSLKNPGGASAAR